MLRLFFANISVTVQRLEDLFAPGNVEDGETVQPQLG